MKSIILTIITVVTLVNVSFSQEHYAILISAGDVRNDDDSYHSEYWYDLFLAYEDLILNQGYSHDDIFVFYGDGAGDDFASSHAQYNISTHGWTGIVDFDNSYVTMNSEFANIASTITSEDNILIRWVCGHGSSSTQDNYYVCIDNEWGSTTETITESNLIAMINQISNYKRRKIIWMTCHSGCLVTGTQTLNNNKTTVITSCAWNEVSYSHCPNCSGGSCGCLDESNVTCELNWVVTSSLSGIDPVGNTYNGDNDADNVISMEDLFQEASSSSIMSSTAQLGDNSSLSEKIFIREDLTLENINITADHEYWAESIIIRNLKIQNNSEVIFEIDDEIEFERDFQVDLGSTFEVINND
jgi:hypothetical protein